MPHALGKENESPSGQILLSMCVMPSAPRARATTAKGQTLDQSAHRKLESIDQLDLCKGRIKLDINWHAMVGWILAERGATEITTNFCLIRVSRYVYTFEQYASTVTVLSASCI
ncbi:hypothetical protein P692DRAFT_20842515 [Suillus brevipes Sb2]|nr:hypothetical protein P692DRAFT_20842515 [Suillus brevipes Sb2]